MKHAFLLAAALAAGPVFADDQLKLNQIQVIGSHNSYHAGLPAGVVKLLDYYNAPMNVYLSI